MKTFAIHVGLPEERLLFQCLNGKDGDMKQHIFNRNSFSNELMAFSSFEEVKGNHVILFASYASPGNVSHLLEICPRVTLYSWNMLDDAKKYPVRMDVEGFELADVNGVFLNFPPWVMEIGRVPEEENEESEYLHRGIIETQQRLKTDLDTVYHEMLYNSLPQDIENCRQTGKLIFMHQKKIAEEIVAKQSIVFHTDSGKNVCFVIGPYTPVRPFVRAALHRDFVDPIDIGVLLRHDGQKGTFLSFEVRPGNTELLDFVNEEPFLGGGRTTLKGCSFRTQFPIDCIIELIKRCA